MPNIKVLEKVVNKRYSLAKLIGKYTGTTPQYSRPCFCPFHDNTNTPAAVIYNNEDGDSLYCFSEKRNYTSSDYLTKQGYDIYALGQRLWEQMPDFEKAEYTSTVNVSDFNVETKSDNKVIDVEVVKYQSGKSSIADILGKLVEQTEEIK